MLKQHLKTRAEYIEVRLAEKKAQEAKGYSPELLAEVKNIQDDLALHIVAMQGESKKLDELLSIAPEGAKSVAEYLDVETPAHFRRQWAYITESTGDGWDPESAFRMLVTAHELNHSLGKFAVKMQEAKQVSALFHAQDDKQADAYDVPSYITLQQRIGPFSIGMLVDKLRKQNDEAGLVKLDQHFATDKGKHDYRNLLAERLFSKDQYPQFYPAGVTGDPMNKEKRYHTLKRKFLGLPLNRQLDILQTFFSNVGGEESDQARLGCNTRFGRNYALHRINFLNYPNMRELYRDQAFIDAVEIVHHELVDAQGASFTDETKADEAAVLRRDIRQLVDVAIELDVEAGYHAKRYDGIVQAAAQLRDNAAHNKLFANSEKMQSRWVKGLKAVESGMYSLSGKLYAQLAEVEQRLGNLTYAQAIMAKSSEEGDKALKEDVARAIQFLEERRVMLMSLLGNNQARAHLRNVQLASQCRFETEEFCAVKDTHFHNSAEEANATPFGGAGLALSDDETTPLKQLPEYGVFAREAGVWVTYETASYKTGNEWLGHGWRKNFWAEIVPTVFVNHNGQTGLNLSVKQIGNSEGSRLLTAFKAIEMFNHAAHFYVESKKTEALPQHEKAVKEEAKNKGEPITDAKAQEEALKRFRADIAKDPEYLKRRDNKRPFYATGLIKTKKEAEQHRFVLAMATLQGIRVFEHRLENPNGHCLTPNDADRDRARAFLNKQRGVNNETLNLKTDFELDEIFDANRAEERLNERLATPVRPQ